MANGGEKKASICFRLRLGDCRLPFVLEKHGRAPDGLSLRAPHRSFDAADVGLLRRGTLRKRHRARKTHERNNAHRSRGIQQPRGKIHTGHFTPRQAGAKFKFVPGGIGPRGLDRGVGSRPGGLPGSNSDGPSRRSIRHWRRAIERVLSLRGENRQRPA